ncbi:hypothetical protein CALCODRAFT_111914 [Calocera cornea HHB12733]|uniref:Uncharacterized protein n=1 Tax=Calocera cornea HHB12733 TaxID=1353952 RepID=A0A165D1G6_9BASI|nr:hypothetical protein CALCODRAFT_111914 [Calocera cornea HHB12733]
MSGDLLNTTVPSTDSSISYTPTSVWGIDIGPGAIGGAAYFDNAFAAAFINYAASQPITGVEWWGYQRSDHGLASICFDCPATSTGGIRVDYLNTSTNGTESPRLLYSTYNLTYAIHNLTIANLFDTRTPPPTTSGSFGQMSIDRFVLFAPSTPPSSSGPSSSSPASTGSDSAAPTAGAGTSNSNNGSSSSHRNAGAIAGGVVGGIAALLIIFALLWFFFFRKRRQTGSPQDMNGGEHPFEAKDGSFVQPNPVTPFILGSAPQAPAHLMQPMPMTHAVQSIPMAAQVAPMAGE